MLVGFGAGGTQNLINSYLAIYYRPFNRGTGVGSALAFGRIGGIVGPLYGGVILAAGASTAMNFCAFVVRGRPGIAGLRARPARDGCEGVMTTGEAGTSMRIVALEEHFVRPDLVARIDPDVIAARGWPLASADQPASMKRDDPLEDVGAGRLASMDRAGISVQVLSSATPGPELLPPEEAIEFARAYNDGLAATVREHPDRYAGFATLPLRAPAAAADELERAVVELGFVGTMVNGTTDGKFLDAPEFDVVLARAAALGVPVYVHPNLPVPEVFAAHYAGLPGTTGFIASMAGWGWHSETAVHVLRLVLSGALDRHPDLKIVVGHMGEGLPSCWSGSTTNSPREAGHLSRSVSRTILDQVWITTSGIFSVPAFLATMLTFGVDRIMFSVDYPYADNERATRFLDALPLSPADRLAVAGGNADALLGLASTRGGHTASLAGSSARVV